MRFDPNDAPSAFTVLPPAPAQFGCACRPDHLRVSGCTCHADTWETWPESEESNGA